MKGSKKFVSILLATSSFLILFYQTNASAVTAYNNFRVLFGNTTSLESYDLDQISSKILRTFNCLNNTQLFCTNVRK